MATSAILPLLVLLAIVIHVTEPTPLAASYQELPERPGYIPVYIRYGNKPLDEINPSLANAFTPEEQPAEQSASESTSTVTIKKSHGEKRHTKRGNDERKPVPNDFNLGPDDFLLKIAIKEN